MLTRHFNRNRPIRRTNDFVATALEKSGQTVAIHLVIFNK
jgi:hypothetical protein